ncbi:MAG: NifB/NifX family molybdenum-iron cluster-binding protein [Bacteroidales bacterium]
MILAIATDKNNNKGIVDPHFGRCDWYCIYDTTTSEMNFIENSAKNNTNAAGSQSAEMLCQQGVKIVVAGRFGTRAAEIFRSNQVQMIIPEDEVTIDKLIKQIH